MSHNSFTSTFFGQRHVMPLRAATGFRKRAWLRQLNENSQAETRRCANTAGPSSPGGLLTDMLLFEYQAVKKGLCENSNIDI